MCPSCATQEYVVLRIINAPWFVTTSFISGEGGHFSALDNPKGGFWVTSENLLLVTGRTARNVGYLAQ